MKGSDLQRTIAELLFYDGWLVLRVNQGGMKTEDGRYIRFAYWSMKGYDFERDDGISDLLAIKGTMLAIEAKGDGDRLRPGQIDFLKAAAEAGAIPIIAESVDVIYPYLSDKVMVQ